MIETFIRQYYEKTHFIPNEILVPMALENALLIEDWLKNLKEKKVRIRRPQRGEKAYLLNMALKNAEKTGTIDLDFAFKIQLSNANMTRQIITGIKNKLTL